MLDDIESRKAMPIARRWRWRGNWWATSCGRPWAASFSGGGSEQQRCRVGCGGKHGRFLRRVSALIEQKVRFSWLEIFLEVSGYAESPRYLRDGPILSVFGERSSL
jgi:hypothetical protein